MGPLTLGKVCRFKHCRQIHNLGYLLQSQGSRVSPEGQSQQNKSCHTAGGLSSPTQEWSETGVQPGLLPYSAPQQEQEHRWPSSPLTHREGEAWEMQLLMQYAAAFCFWPVLQLVPCSFSGLQFVGSWAFFAALCSNRCFCFVTHVLFHIVLHCPDFTKVNEE